MNLTLTPLPLHPILNSFVELLIKEMPPKEPQEGEEAQLTALWSAFNHYTDCPGVLVELRTHTAIYLAEFKVSLSNAAAYGIRAQQDDSVFLSFYRKPTHQAHERQYGERAESYTRKLRDASGQLDVNLDAFLPQVVESVKFFFTHHHPGAVPEFNNWLHPLAGRVA